VLNQKDIMILEFLNQNTDPYIKSQTIADYLGVTDKTARKYVKQLAGVLDPEIARIESIPGHGFRLAAVDTKTFRKYLQKNKDARHEKTDISYIEESKDRQYFILRQFFFGENQLFIENLMEDLAVSQSTLLNDIYDINKKFKDFDLFLKTSKKTGMSIVGEEQDKRHFIMSYFFVERLQNNLKCLGEISKLLTTISSEEILLIVLDECRNAELKLSDTVMLNIVIHIALAMKRVEEGYQINFDQQFNSVAHEKEYETAKNIVTRLRKSSDIDLPHEEVHNIALHLRNKRSNVSSDAAKNEKSSVEKQIIAVLEKMDADLGVRLSHDPVLLNGLNDHFSPFLNRLRKKNKLKNPFLTEMKTNYQPELELTETYFSQMPELVPYTVTEDEWAYIALHIIAALERDSRNEKIRTLVICATGLGSSQMLKVRLENEMGSKLDIVDVISYYEISDDLLEDIDLIVSSIDLSNVVFNIPVVNVSVLLNQEDIKAINQIIGQNRSLKRESKIEKKISRHHLSDWIDTYFNPELFVRSETIRTRKEAIAVLSEKSAQLDDQINEEFLKRQLRLRENFSSVVFSKNIAVPHPVEGIGDFSKVGILITPHGIDWDESSNEVKLTVLMIPDRFGNNHLDEVSKALLPIIENQAYLDELITAASFEAFKEKLLSLLS